MEKTNTYKKYILLAIVTFVIFGIIFANLLGKKQDSVFTTDNTLYSQSLSKMQEGDYEGALKLTSRFQNNQYSSEAVNYLISISAANAGEAKTALIHMQRTLEINPYKVEDSMFMLQYAEILLMAQRIEEAQKVLEQCETLIVPEKYPQYKEKVAELKAVISTK